MARLKDSTVDAVKAAADLVAIVEDRTALRKQGARMMGRCPFHEERTASFSVNPAKGLYHCFGCHASGDAITFVRETQGLDFTGAIEDFGPLEKLMSRNIKKSLKMMCREMQMGVAVAQLAITHARGALAAEAVGMRGLAGVRRRKRDAAIISMAPSEREAYEAWCLSAIVVEEGIPTTRLLARAS